MLWYIDENGTQEFKNYGTDKEKTNAEELFLSLAKETMREDELTEFRYAVIDFNKDQSTVFIMNREVTETFSITGC